MRVHSRMPWLGYICTSCGGGWDRQVWAGDRCFHVAAWPPLSPTGVPQVNEVVFSPSESHCATGGEDGSVRVWSLASMELVIQFQVLNQVCVSAGGTGIHAQDRARAMSCASSLLRLPSDPSLGLVPCHRFPGECSCFPTMGPQSCICLAWSPPSCSRPEQQQVVAGYSDGTLRIFSISRTAMELKMHPHRAALTAIAFSTDGEKLGCSGWPTVPPSP